MCAVCARCKRDRLGSRQAQSLTVEVQLATLEMLSDSGCQWRSPRTVLVPVLLAAGLATLIAVTAQPCTHLHTQLATPLQSRWGSTTTVVLRAGVLLVVQRIMMSKLKPTLGTVASVFQPRPRPRRQRQPQPRDCWMKKRMASAVHPPRGGTSQTRLWVGSAAGTLSPSPRENARHSRG